MPTEATFEICLFLSRHRLSLHHSQLEYTSLTSSLRRILTCRWDFVCNWASWFTEFAWCVEVCALERGRLRECESCVKVGRSRLSSAYNCYSHGSRIQDEEERDSWAARVLCRRRSVPRGGDSATIKYYCSSSARKAAGILPRAKAIWLSNKWYAASLSFSM